MWRRVDDVLRFGYVLLSPAMIAGLAGLLPVTGILISTAIATIIALTNPTKWITFVRPIKLIGKPLAKFGKLGEYYRVNDPKPLLFYVLFPLLIPYWLFKRSARKEFLAYKRLGVLALIITLATSIYDYFHNWTPLPGKYFLNAMFAVAVMQVLFTFMFVMPIVTTLVRYKRDGHRKSLVAILSIGLLLGGALWFTMRKLEVVPFTTQLRIKWRIKHEPERARVVMRESLDAAILSGKKGREVMPFAREKLEQLFRPDEARAFRIASRDNVGVIFVKTKNHQWAWAARTPTTWIENAGNLPPEIRNGLELSPTSSVWP